MRFSGAHPLDELEARDQVGPQTPPLQYPCERPAAIILIVLYHMYHILPRHRSLVLEAILCTKQFLFKHFGFKHLCSINLTDIAARFGFKLF